MDQMNLDFDDENDDDENNDDNASPPPEEPEELTLKRIDDRLVQLEEQIKELVHLLGGMLKPDRLWKIDEVADHLNVSEMTARRMMSHPTAPKAVRVPTVNGTHPVTNWVAQEIIDYATRTKHRVTSDVKY